jgi:hypothetical protein
MNSASGLDALWIGVDCQRLRLCRLKEAESTDKYVPKIQFPPTSLCGSCRNTNPSAEKTFDVAWHETEVWCTAFS